MRINFVFTINILNNTSSFANRVLLALFAVRLGASPVMVGVLGAMFAVFPTLLAVVAGRLADRIGSRYPMIAGTVGMAVGMLVPYFWPTLPAILFAALMCGFAQVFVNVCTQNLTGVLSTPETRSRNFANYALTNSTGQFLGPLLGGFSIDHLSNTHASLLLAVFATLPFWLLMWDRRPLEPAHLRRKEAREEAARSGGALEMLKNPAVRQSLYTGSLLNSGLNLYQFYMPVYATSVGASASVVGIIMAMNSTAAFCIRALLPMLINRWKEDRVLVLAFVCGALSLTLVPFTANAWVLGLLSFVFGLGMGVGQPIVNIQMFANSPKGRSGEGIGLKMTTNQLTKLVSPVAFGAVATALGLSPMFWLNALLLTTGGWMARPKKDAIAARDVTAD